MADYDLAIIGGGINGTGLARDANLVVAKPTADESVDPRSSGTSARRLDECPASDEMPCAVA